MSIIVIAKNLFQTANHDPDRRSRQFAEYSPAHDEMGLQRLMSQYLFG